ncbi:MAG TPA: hypothetical protein VEA80_02900 [Vitreimonas sp.]|uniref:hypothetical protein n=1 Tax=Vitreimonas sp. TaxID=3069702 RepID=UPI002D5FC175|nr:hypothetical protein [Vitreimonas sp.]HYD86401.1 hypothetical protein [Vitreimonas sp.]
MFPIKPTLKRSLDAARNNSGMTFTSLMALVSSSFGMSVTGGGLTAYEARAMTATVASMFGDQAAAAELERATPYSTASAVHLIPLQPIAFTLAEDARGPDGELLGGPPLERARVFAVADAQALAIAPACADGDPACAHEVSPEFAQAKLAVSIAAF